MAYIIALTGGIGSGKSTAANTFALHGGSIVDSDVIAKQVVEPGTSALAKIAAYFGKEVLLANGALNRLMIRDKIFSKPASKIWINQLLHPLIHQESRRQLSQITSPYALWVVPLLVENGWQNYANRVLVIDVSTEIQLSRAVARDGFIYKKQIENILLTQATRAERLAIADDIIDNSGDTIEVERLASSLHYRYLELASSLYDTIES